MKFIEPHVSHLLPSASPAQGGHSHLQCNKTRGCSQCRQAICEQLLPSVTVAFRFRFALAVLDQNGAPPGPTSRNTAKQVSQTIPSQAMRHHPNPPWRTPRSLDNEELQEAALP